MSEKLRIALFSDSALPILNGVSVSIDLLMQGLRDAGHSVHLFAPGGRSVRDIDPNIHRFRAVETPWTRGYPLAYPPFLGMLRRFRKFEFDLIHTHTPFTVGFVGLRWAESHEIPIVSTYHTLYDRYAHYIPYFPRRYVRYKCAKHTNYYYNRVAHVLVPSYAALRWLRRHSVHTPASIVPTSIAKPQLLDRQECRRQLGMGADRRVMLYVGRVAPEKNLATLLIAAARVLAAEPKSELWLVGDGPYRPDCMAQVAQLGIGDRVRFVGAVPRDRVDLYYAAADLFVFPSITETQGLVVAEAMSYGLPAVVVNGGGAGESVEDGLNGRMVRNHPEALADAVLELLSQDREFAELSEGARLSMREREPDAMVQRVVQIYRQVLEQGPTNRQEGELVWR